LKKKFKIQKFSENDGFPDKNWFQMTLKDFKNSKKSISIKKTNFYNLLEAFRTIENHLEA